MKFATTVTLVLFTALLVQGRLPAQTPSVTSRRPSVYEAQSILRERISKESNERIKLANFAMKLGKADLMEINGEKVVPVSFTAHVEFAERCKWASALNGRPLTFSTYALDSGEAPAATSENRVFEILQLGERFVLHGDELLAVTDDGWKLVGFGSVKTPQRASDESSGDCVNQLKQIGLSFRLWAGDNNDHYPFNVSTNNGGTSELSSPGNDGWDKNGYLHLRVMSNELNVPKILICPADLGKRPVIGFQRLESDNVSYLIRSGGKVDELHPDEVLGRCPIHGHMLFSDGRVERVEKKDKPPISKKEIEEDAIAARNNCINNLRQIDGAKQQWALEKNKESKDVPTSRALAEYLRNGKFPTCLGGGDYTIGNMEQDPTCSLPGHALPTP